MRIKISIKRKSVMYLQRLIQYGISSGHRILFASKRAGLTEVPALIVEMDRDNAAIALVDSNLHRDNISPSEKAFAYKLKMEAMSRQGHRTDLTSGQLVPKSDDNRTSAKIGEPYGESYKTVQCITTKIHARWGVDFCY